VRPNRLSMIGPMLPEAARGTRLVEAIAAQDVAGIATCFAADAQFRALVPPGLRERTGAPDAASLIAGWFADSTELELVDSETTTVGDRLHVAYRFVGVEEGQPYIVEQHLFGTFGDGKITQADLLCSGFRPRRE
jgi:ketosteroid isomerase-like protein